MNVATEIERKFLVKRKAFALFLASSADTVTALAVIQGYLHTTGVTTRVRLVDGVRGFLTIKGKRTSKFGRPEFEYPVPKEDALALLPMCKDNIVSKTRYVLPVLGSNLIWEVDLFSGELEGLAMAEIELTTDEYPFVKPSWLGKEVSDDKRYTNKHLAVAKKIPKGKPGKPVN